MTGSDESTSETLPKDQTGTEETADTPPIGDRRTFSTHLTDCIRAARANGVSVDGRWTISSYEVVISGQQVTILDAGEPGASDEN